ncbi:MAG: DegT/DnrJ/EryC1/StrS family aminotransferase [Vulcanimicrobiota bacterium]
MNIPMVDLKTQYHNIKSEIDEAMSNVLEASAFIMGPDVKKLEEEVAQFSQVRHAIAVGSGTEALHIALLSSGIGPGDEVIVPTFTFIATAEVVSLVGARPVFADIDAGTYNIDPRDVEKKITAKTRAIIPVHLYGQPADMDELMKIARAHNLVVIEDCAQAMGAVWKGTMVGTIGDVGCLSFFPSKNLGGYGDGGMILTNRDDVADKARAIRVHGSNKKYFHHLIGVNSRLDTLQAAILRVKLRYLAKWNDMRRAAAARYSKALEGSAFVTPVTHHDAVHVFHQYTIRAPKRNELQNYLKEKGVASMIYYPLCLHQQGAFAHFGGKEGDMPVAEKAQNEVLSLPMFPELSEEQTSYVAEALQAFAREVVQHA